MVKFKNYIIAVSLSLLTSIGAVYADVSSEAIALDALVEMLSSYADNHGKVPMSWEEFERDWNLDALNRSIPDGDRYPIQDRYKFVTSPLSLPNLEGSQILLVRTSPITREMSSSSIGRYVIYALDGMIQLTKVSEPSIQKIFSVSDPPHSEYAPSPVTIVPYTDPDRAEVKKLFEKGSIFYSMEPKRHNAFVVNWYFIVVCGLGMLCIMTIGVFFWRRKG